MKTDPPIQLSYGLKAPIRSRIRARWYGLLFALCSRRARRIYGWIFLIASALGYISNFMTRVAAEDETARRAIWNRPSKWSSGSQYWPPAINFFWVQNAQSNVIFRRIGVPPTPRNPFGPPWDHVEVDRGRVYLPFICRVHHEEWSLQVKTEGVDWHFCLFGRAWIIRGQTYQMWAVS